ncbi:MAG: LytTR family DNA-binding domain-containing protein [Inconstantimicrobium porci]|uniref:LytR/AlgR family response regulator transcription factor n=1 Tax=Inconstantimicrobium porci TaxID=2652291 RepID=UPI002A91ECFD|nr:LytTR family DNA-binding domain-containing protein [Inconstantimicrobium porci]MDY5913113.1 LytTR family DNA-binding domain-containing protein [Inconstantimicrobium porci]
MKKLCIAYCDDEDIQLCYMDTLIKQWSEENKISYCLSIFKSAEEFLFENEGNYPFDLVFLDVDMKAMNGMELARKIREKDKNIIIIFITNYEKYVFEGYEVNAYRYLLKPINEEKVADVLNSIIKNNSQEKKYIIEKYEGELKKIDLGDILYFEAKGHYVYIHTINEIVIVKKSLQDEIKAVCQNGQALFENGFVSTHRSFIVNLKYIEQILKNECVLTNADKVPISRNAYKDVNESFIRYYREN